MTTTLATRNGDIDQALRRKADTDPAALAEYRGRLAERAAKVSKLEDGELRRFAVTAANERNVDDLWRLTEAYIVTKGRKKATTSLATLDSYRIGLERLLKHWQGENLLRPSRDAGERYVTDLQVGKHGDRPLEPGTIQVRLAAARALYRALRWAQATELAPFADVEAPADPTSAEEKRTAYTEEEVESLLYVADELDAVIVLLGSDAGLRADEMLNLRWDDVNASASEIRVRSGKGGKRRTTEATPDLIDALQAWRTVNTNRRPGMVIPFGTTAAARLRLKKLCKLANVKYLGLHSLRHSCGTWYAQNSARGIEDARIQLGHASISTTQIYAKMDRRTLKAAAQRRRRVQERKPEGPRAA